MFVSTVCNTISDMERYFNTKRIQMHSVLKSSRHMKLGIFGTGRPADTQTDTQERMHAHRQVDRQTYRHTV